MHLPAFKKGVAHTLAPIC